MVYGKVYSKKCNNYKKCVTKHRFNLITQILNTIEQVVPVHHLISRVFEFVEIMKGNIVIYSNIKQRSATLEDHIFGCTHILACFVCNS